MTEGLRLRVDRRSPVPLYHQIATQLAEAIDDGTLPAGTKLENEIALADQLGLSRPTMRRAIEELVGKGLLVRKRGVGTQVVHGRMRRELELTSLYDDLAAEGRTPSTSVLVNRVEPAPADVAEQLGLAPGSDVRRLERVRRAGGAPLALLRNWLPADVLTAEDDELESRGLYELLRERGVHLRIARQRIGARGSTAAEGELLDVAPGQALLTMQRTAYGDSGRAVEYGDHCYRPDSYSIEVTVVER
ncbi:GntR family transcriptional regulator [Nocardioides sp. CER19]|uniref:GntR family transcriptional regulator n=1 Tax=Nocardioides sp. CER19 TaxID=3038538 RepID=UPI00244795B2|nr:GntR family transcriptional regulator [Nocardioides sp. CER19]MDH2414025.1 GntR family transcriptional regulator [Nocardioides sp. CER19]